MHYWPVLGCFKNWNSIQLSQKSTPSDAFNEIHQVFLDGISDNMALLVEPGKFGSINTTDITTNEFYVIMFIRVNPVRIESCESFRTRADAL